MSDQTFAYPLTALERAWLEEVDRDIKKHNLRGSDLYWSFAERFEGELTINDVASLVRKGFLTREPVPKSDWNNSGLLGDRVRVMLTERAIKQFWPERLR